MLHNTQQLNKSNIACPQCDTEFPEGTEVCPKCSYDFRLKKCPYCKAKLERGAILGSKYHLAWFPGKTTWKTNVDQYFGGGEIISKESLFKGIFVTGSKCTACRKIILSY